MIRAPLLAATACLALIAAPALAQVADIAAQRQAVFQQMLADPSNRQLMRDYARLSVEMRDFEAAVSTLERLVDLEPTNSAARAELAVAYFALGAYAVADYHLAAAEASGALSPAQQAQIARYREEAADRGDGSDYSGRIEAGYAWVQETEDQGAYINAAIDWRIDMGGAFSPQWVTEFGYTLFDPEDGFNRRENIRLRTGPEFQIAGDAYGPRLQPYLELGWFEDDPDIDGAYTYWALGAAYINPIDARFTIYADLAYGQELESDEFGVGDFEVYDLDLGITYRPSRETRFRLSGNLSARNQIDDAFFDTDFTEASVRLSAQHAFSPGFIDLPNRWIFGGFAQATQREADDGFTVTTIDEQAYGLWLRAFVFEDVYIETSATQLNREQDSGGFFTTSSDDVVYTVQLGWEF